MNAVSNYATKDLTAVSPYNIVSRYIELFSEGNPAFIQKIETYSVLERSAYSSIFTCNLSNHECSP